MELQQDWTTPSTVTLVVMMLMVLLQVVGSQARILYSDCRGRVALAVAFNAAVRHRTLAVRYVTCYTSHIISVLTAVCHVNLRPYG